MIKAANLVPGEILAQVFATEGTECRDLKSYSLVSSKWRSAAQYELFRTSIFAIRHLDAPPQFIPFSTMVENTEYAYLGFVVGRIRIGFKSLSPVDPNFYDFLGSLTRIHTIYFENDMGKLLSERVPTPELRYRLVNLLHSTTLTKVIIDADEFPLWILRSCQHVKNLTFTFPSHHVSEEDPLNDRGSCSRKIEEFNFSGDGYALHSFAIWLRESDVVSVDKIQRATFDIPTIMPAFERNIFMGFVSLSYLTFKTTTLGTQSRYDLSHLINLTTLNIETDMDEITAQHHAASRLNIASAISWWARSFIITLPVPSKLRNFAISLFGTYATNRDFMAVPEGDADYHLGILQEALLKNCHCLSTLSFYLYCTFLSREDLNRIFSQLGHTHVFLHDPAGRLIHSKIGPREG